MEEEFLVKLENPRLLWLNSVKDKDFGHVKEAIIHLLNPEANNIKDRIKKIEIKVGVWTRIPGCNAVSHPKVFPSPETIEKSYVKISEYYLKNG